MGSGRAKSPGRHSTGMRLTRIQSAQGWWMGGESREHEGSPMVLMALCRKHHFQPEGGNGNAQRVPLPR